MRELSASRMCMIATPRAPLWVGGQLNSIYIQSIMCLCTIWWWLEHYSLTLQITNRSTAVGKENVYLMPTYKQIELNLRILAFYRRTKTYSLKSLKHSTLIKHPFNILAFFKQKPSKTTTRHKQIINRKVKMYF